MRSVFVHLENASEAELQAFLDNAYPGQRDPWIAAVNGDACLYINILDPAEIPEEWSATFAGRSFSVSVCADVSGRHSGDVEVRHLVTTLLRRFRGAASDDYTENLWSLDDILAGAVKEGHPFFDYQGWYHDTRESPNADA